MSLPEFGSPEHTRLQAESDQQAQMFSNMLDCYVQAAHVIGQGITEPPFNVAEPYGADAAAMHSAMLRESIKGEVPYDDLICLLAVAIARIAKGDPDMPAEPTTLSGDELKTMIEARDICQSKHTYHARGAYASILAMLHHSVLDGE